METQPTLNYGEGPAPLPNMALVKLKADELISPQSQKKCHSPSIIIQEANRQSSTPTNIQIRIQFKPTIEAEQLVD